MQPQDIWSIVSLLFGIIVLIYTFRANQRGRILGQLDFIERNTHPKIFRLYVVLYTIIGFMSILIPLFCKFYIFK
ncbi:MAG: hypothetical protein R3F48_00690 [Candidatus Zixiibacteriota bacterium]